MPFNWDETKPGDSDIVSQFPANERAARATARAAFAVEHDPVGGRHTLAAGSTEQRASFAPWPAGGIFINYDDVRRRLQRAEAADSSWVEVGQEFAAGTQMLFHANVAPVGWTRRTDHDDRLLRINANANMSFGGQWPITGIAVVNDGHYHGVSGVTGNNNQDHAHTYSGTTAQSAAQVAVGNGANGVSVNGHTHTYSGTTSGVSAAHDHNFAVNSGVPSVGHTHSQDGSWRPAYLDMMLAQKN